MQALHADATTASASAIAVTTNPEPDMISLKTTGLAATAIAGLIATAHAAPTSTCYVNDGFAMPIWFSVRTISVFITRTCWPIISCSKTPLARSAIS